MKAKYIVNLSIYCMLYFTLLYLVFKLGFEPVILGVLVELFTIPTMLLSLLCLVFGLVLLLVGKVKGKEKQKLIVTSILMAVLSFLIFSGMFANN